MIFNIMIKNSCKAAQRVAGRALYFQLRYEANALSLARLDCSTVELQPSPRQLTALIETKKLKFHTPDINGKSKCHYLHIENPSKLCPELKVHGKKMGQGLMGTLFQMMEEYNQYQRQNV